MGGAGGLPLCETAGNWAAPTLPLWAGSDRKDGREETRRAQDVWPSGRKPQNARWTSPKGNCPGGQHCGQMPWDCRAGRRKVCGAGVRGGGEKEKACFAWQLESWYLERVRHLFKLTLHHYLLEEFKELRRS